MSIDVLASRKKLAIFAGSCLGLMVGVAIAYALSFVIQLLVQQFVSVDGADPTTGLPLTNAQVNELKVARDALQSFLTLVCGCLTTYLSISFILQTKDDFRFIIPYVEFRKQLRGNRPLLLDTSALIDGRVVPMLETGIFESQIIVPRFVLTELQTVADSADRLKRNRGRRGLDIVAKLQATAGHEVVTYDTPNSNDHDPVDQRLITLAKELEARLVTTDYNLNKVAQLAGVDVLNVNELATKLKPEVLPGERLRVKVIKPGESPGQGIGYMDDGTMVVIEQGRPHIDSEVEFVVTNTVQTAAGKMIFGRIGDGPVQRGRAAS
ncbi:MAG: TRAM domain-containing protein [Tepidisphaeraceae bacterium]